MEYFKKGPSTTPLKPPKGETGRRGMRNAGKDRGIGYLYIVGEKIPYMLEMIFSQYRVSII